MKGRTVPIVYVSFTFDMVINSFRFHFKMFLIKYLARYALIEAVCYIVFYNAFASR